MPPLRLLRLRQSWRLSSRGHKRDRKEKEKKRGNLNNSNKEKGKRLLERGKEKIKEERVFHLCRIGPPANQLVHQQTLYLSLALATFVGSTDTGQMSVEAKEKGKENNNCKERATDNNNKVRDHNNNLCKHNDLSGSLVSKVIP